jgi:hypothetical protein
VVLVRPRLGGIEEEALPRLVPRLEAIVVDSVVNDTQALAGQPEQPLRALTDEFARDDRDARRPRRTVVGEAPQEPARRAHRLTVQDVVQRHRRRHLRARVRDRERVVDRVQPVQLRVPAPELPVLELPVLLESGQETAHVRLRAAHLSRPERHERDADQATASRTAATKFSMLGP